LPLILMEPLVSQIQAAKAAVEILLIASFIYLLTRERERQIGQMREQLQQERRELSLLHRVVRHNLRNDLTVIRAHADMLTDAVADGGRALSGAAEEPPDSGAESGEAHRCRPADNCAAIRRVIERMERYTDQAKRIRQVGTLDEPQRTFDLATTVQGVVDRNEHTDCAEVTTSLAPVTVEANYMLPEALSELVTNAVIHNDEKPSVTVEVVPDDGGDGVVVRIQDDGPGIPPDEYEPLSQEGEGQLVHLSGLGLWFVQWTVDLSSGEVAFDADDEGTVVQIWLPIAEE